MGDPEQDESAAAGGVACNAEPLEQIKLRKVLARGDDGYNSEVNPGLLLNAGGSEGVPFFPCFFHNLGPRYQATNSDGLALEMTPSGWGPSKFHNTDFDIYGKKSPESSRPAVQAEMAEHFASDELSSTCKALIRTSSARAGGVLKDHRPSTSSERATCKRQICVYAADGLYYGLLCQCTPVPSTGRSASCHRTSALLCQCTPVSSTGSSASCHRTPVQCRKSTSRDLPGKEKELQDYRSPWLISKRLRLDVGSEQELPQTTSAVLPSWRDDFHEIIHDMQVAQSRSAELRRRLRMSISPAKPVVSRSTEAMDRTLVKLQHWHSCLRLDNPACPVIASHIFWRAVKMFKNSKWSQKLPETHDRVRVRVLMATAFWVAAKLVDTRHKIPKASVMASTARITSKNLIQSELPLLDALQWKLVQC